MNEQREGIAVVVIAGRRKGLTTICDELAAAAPDLPVVVVGDALSPRTLLDATAEGARAGASVPLRDSAQTVRAIS
jgi:DNA-binding NarL/FixJ family response regulator